MAFRRNVRPFWMFQIVLEVATLLFSVSVIIWALICPVPGQKTNRSSTQSFVMLSDNETTFSNKGLPQGPFKTIPLSDISDYSNRYSIVQCRFHVLPPHVFHLCRSLCDKTADNFCSDPAIFPDEAVAEIMSKIEHDPKLSHLMHMFKASEPPRALLSRPEEQAGREGQSGAGEGYEYPVCARQSSYVYPKRAMNKHKEYKFILNGPDGAGNPFQVVRVETCYKPDSPCNFPDYQSISNEPYTVCRQQFSYVKLLALKNDKGIGNSFDNVELDSFQFPSACVCFRKKHW